MRIDLRNTVIKRKLRSFYLAIFFVLAIIFILLADVREDKIAGVDKYGLSIIMAAIYLLLIFYNAIRNFNYIFYSDEGDKIIFRFFSLSIFTNQKSSIEMFKKDFAGFKIKKSYSGLKENLILYQKANKGVAKYPPVSITALTGKEKSSILNSLSKLGKKF